MSFVLVTYDVSECDQCSQPEVLSVKGPYPTREAAEAHQGVYDKIEELTAP